MHIMNSLCFIASVQVFIQVSALNCVLMLTFKGKEYSFKGRLLRFGSIYLLSVKG